MNIAPTTVVRSLSAGFRPDIQGLRALAVIAVIAYHADGLLPGGFVGVDVFFVLSGFLIVGILIRERETTGRIALGRFFVRRFRRLVPALSLVTAVTVAVAALVVELGDVLAATVRTAYAAIFFVANLELYRQADYFAPESAQNPLLHTWSLAVEEQFYIFIPFIFVVLSALVARVGRDSDDWRRAAFVATTLLTAISLAASILVTDLGLTPGEGRDPQRFGFFIPVTRAWEFGAGALLTFLHTNDRRVARSAPFLKPVGMMLILGSMLTLTSSMAFPGMRAIPVVIGTMLVLHSAPRKGVVDRLLGSRPAIRLGDLSYSLYLWHWPFIVLGKAAFGASPLVIAAAVTASVIVADASYRLVEQPWRHGTIERSGRGARSVAAVVAVPIFAAAGAGALNIAMAPAEDWGRSWSRADCNLSRADAISWNEERCVRGAESFPPTGPWFLLLGDSHADALADGVLLAAEAKGVPLGVWTRSGTPVVGRLEWQTSLHDLVERSRPTAVIIAQRSTGRLDTDQMGRWTDALPVDERVRQELWLREVETSVERFLQLGTEVIWVVSVPEFEQVRGGTALGPTILRPGGTGLTLSQEDLIDQRRSIVLEELRVLDGRNGVMVVDPAELLCDPDCRTIHEGTLLYRDSNHLSTLGSKFLASLFEEAMSDSLERSRSAPR